MNVIQVHLQWLCKLLLGAMYKTASPTVIPGSHPGLLNYSFLESHAKVLSLLLVDSLLN